MADFDLGKVFRDAFAIEQMKRERAAAPLQSAQSALPFMLQNPGAKLSPELIQALSGQGGGVEMGAPGQMGTPGSGILGDVSGMVKAARTNELRKEMTKFRRNARSQQASNEAMLSTILGNDPDRDAKIKQFRSMSATRAQEDLNDFLNEYPDMMNDPMGRQMMQDLVNSFKFESGGIDYGAAVNMPPTPQRTPITGR